MYEEDFSLSGGEGPSRLKVKGIHVQYFWRLHHPVYQFASYPSKNEMQRYIERALDEMSMDTVRGDPLK